MTANATWNIWNFRRPVVEALLADGNQVTVLAPLDDAVRDLEHLGCRVRPLAMSVQGLNPSRGSETSVQIQTDISRGTARRCAELYNQE